MGAENLANEAAITPGAIVRSSLLIPGPSKRTEGRLVHHFSESDIWVPSMECVLFLLNPL